jgi:hypothetical protein
MKVKDLLQQIAELLESGNATLDSQVLPAAGCECDWWAYAHAVLVGRDQVRLLGIPTGDPTANDCTGCVHRKHAGACDWRNGGSGKPCGCPVRTE